jgi:hypothetical protein
MDFKELKKYYLSRDYTQQLGLFMSKGEIKAFKDRIKAVEDKVYNIIGYGSLMNYEDARRTFGTILDFRSETIKGWERIFNLDADYAYLNVRKNPEAEIEVAVLSIDGKSMLGFVTREILYDIVTVELSDGTEAFMVVSSLTNDELPPLLSYVGLCIEGMKSLGDVDKFLDETLTNYGTLREWLTNLDIVDYFKNLTYVSR